MVRLVPINESPKVLIDRSHKVYAQSEKIERAWTDLCAHNPRYFNGSMLAFESYDAASNTIRARVEQYKHHAVRDIVDVGISLLAVTAILVAPDRDRNAPVYLLGKRSTELHRYGGLWELGPSGGIDVPRLRNTLKPKRILAELAREIKEEIGMNVASRPNRFRAILHDDGVGSTDIVIAIVLEQVPALKTNWEYIETRWVTLDELVEWAHSNPDELIPTTIEFIRFQHETVRNNE